MMSFNSLRVGVSPSGGGGDGKRLGSGGRTGGATSIFFGHIDVNGHDSQIGTSAMHQLRPIRPPGFPHRSTASDEIAQSLPAFPLAGVPPSASSGSLWSGEDSGSNPAIPRQSVRFLLSAVAGDVLGVGGSGPTTELLGEFAQ
jgi:hypothetical protein